MGKRGKRGRRQGAADNLYASADPVPFPDDLGQIATLIVSGSGTFRVTGFADTPGLFTLTTQGDAITTFSASTVAQEAVPTPEPMSIALLGTAQAGFGLIRRRKFGGA